MARKEPGSIRFEKEYSEIWKERWEDLRKALLEPTHQTAWSDGLLQPYFLDKASLIPPQQLSPESGMKVLDLCAAPGGKSLVLAVMLNGKGVLHLNDLSSDRIRRLKLVLKDHLSEKLAAPIIITKSDGSQMGIRIKNSFDRILLDAPCSSERHVINSPRHLADWTPGRIKNLAIRQFALVASAFDMLKPGGIMVYSTCSIHPDENDNVIAKLMKKRAGLVTLIKPEGEEGESTEHGRIILPDRCGGSGPIYWCKIQKIPQPHSEFA